MLARARLRQRSSRRRRASKCIVAADDTNLWLAKDIEIQRQLEAGMELNDPAGKFWYTPYQQKRKEQWLRVSTHDLHDRVKNSTGLRHAREAAEQLAPKPAKKPRRQMQHAVVLQRCPKCAKKKGVCVALNTPGHLYDDDQIESQ